MKEVQINKIKVKIFTEDELKEKLKLNNDDVNLILEYQRTFPELLQDDVDGFVINGETLCEQLGVKSKFSEWLLANRTSKVGKLIKYNCIENKDYIVIREIAKNSKGGRNKSKIMLTLNCSKKISMRENNKQGDLVCDYFILMEKTLRNYKEWSNIRGIEKYGWNNMKKEIVNWLIRRDFDVTNNYFYIREANLINESLTGLKAYELQLYLKMKDKITRNHLDTEINKAINELQLLNESLLISDMDYETRKGIIKATCNSKYKHLYIGNNISENVC